MGATVLYFAGYKKGEDLFKQDDIEAYTDQVIWCTDSGVEVPPRRPQDAHFRGNIVRAIVAYGKGEIAKKEIELSAVKRIIAIGSDRMMAAVKEARHGVLQPMLDPRHLAIGEHQLADAVHDEGGLRAVPAEAQGSRGVLRI